MSAAKPGDLVRTQDGYGIGLWKHFEGGEVSGQMEQKDTAIVLARCMDGRWDQALILTSRGVLGWNNAVYFDVVVAAAMAR